MSMAMRIAKVGRDVTWKVLTVTVCGSPIAVGVTVAKQGTR